MADSFCINNKILLASSTIDLTRMPSGDRGIWVGIQWKEIRTIILLISVERVCVCEYVEGKWRVFM